MKEVVSVWSVWITLKRFFMAVIINTQLEKEVEEERSSLKKIKLKV
jgi:hypothetical protein